MSVEEAGGAAVDATGGPRILSPKPRTQTLIQPIGQTPVSRALPAMPSALQPWRSSLWMRAHTRVTVSLPSFSTY